jgi:hypothetical protein
MKTALKVFAIINLVWGGFALIGIANSYDDAGLIFIEFLFVGALITHSILTLVHLKK